MIQYALKCNDDHKFDSWFQSASAFDKLRLAQDGNLSGLWVISDRKVHYGTKSGATWQ